MPDTTDIVKDFLEKVLACRKSILFLVSVGGGAPEGEQFTWTCSGHFSRGKEREPLDVLAPDNVGLVVNDSVVTNIKLKVPLKVWLLTNLILKVNGKRYVDLNLLSLG